LKWGDPESIIELIKAIGESIGACHLQGIIFREQGERMTDLKIYERLDMFKSRIRDEYWEFYRTGTRYLNR